MQNYEQIITRMLHEGTITIQQSEYVIKILKKDCQKGVFETIESAKQFFPEPTKNQSSNETLYFEDDVPQQSSRSLETLEIYEPIDTVQSSPENIESTAISPTNKNTNSRITPETISRYKKHQILI